MPQATGQEMGQQGWSIITLLSGIESDRIESELSFSRIGVGAGKERRTCTWGSKWRISSVQHIQYLATRYHNHLSVHWVWYILYLYRCFHFVLFILSPSLLLFLSSLESK